MPARQMKKIEQAFGTRHGAALGDGGYELVWKSTTSHAIMACTALKRIGTVMPYINLQITKGATRSQKATIVKDFTDVLVRVLGKKPEHIHIVIQEINDENWGYSGLLTDDFRKMIE